MKRVIYWIIEIGLAAVALAWAFIAGYLSALA